MVSAVTLQQELVLIVFGGSHTLQIRANILWCVKVTSTEGFDVILLRAAEPDDSSG
jgi:hypothetical protein